MGVHLPRPPDSRSATIWRWETWPGSGRLDGIPDQPPEPAYPAAPEGNPTPAGTSPSHSRLGMVLNWLFRSRRTGRITVVEFPNVPLWIFFATVVMRWVVPTGTWVRTVVNWVAVVALGWWALDEVVRGVNPWRRLLGLLVDGLVVAGAVSLTH